MRCGILFFFFSTICAWSMDMDIILFSVISSSYSSYRSSTYIITVTFVCCSCASTLNIDCDNLCKINSFKMRQEKRNNINDITSIYFTY